MKLDPQHCHKVIESGSGNVTLEKNKEILYVQPYIQLWVKFFLIQMIRTGS
jgi:hypothetical protein